MSKNPAAFFAKAVRDFEAGRFTAADSAVRKLLSEHPNHPDIVYLAGVVASRMERHEDAVRLLEKAAAARPRIAALYGELGVSLLALDRHSEAAAASRRALAIDPFLAGAYVTLARSQFELGHAGDAIETFKIALTRQPDSADVLNDLGNAYLLQKAYSEAIEAYQRAVTLDPHHGKAIEGLLFARMARCDWQGFEDLASRLEADAAADKAAVNPFRALLLWDSPIRQMKAAGAALLRFAHIRPKYKHAPDPLMRPMRVGYLSGNLADHPLPYSIVDVIESHDRSAVEVFGYSTGRDDGSAIRKRIELAFDTFRDVGHLRDAEIADRIYADRIDVLVDLQGHTEGVRFPILALRPAPIQVSWLGFPGTTSAPFIDYVLADEVVAPQSSTGYFTEDIVRLPYCYFPTDRKRAVAGDTPSRSAFGLPENAFIFCSFNNPLKVTPPVFDAWMRILKEVPQGVLWLLADDTTFRNLAAEAKTRGVDPVRLVQTGKMPTAGHLARHRVADLMLDTFPCNAHTTAADALWMGLPVLSLMGRTMTARVAASMLKAVRLPDLVVDSVDAFVATAVRLASEPDLLGSYRRHLLRERDVLPLFDTQRFTGDLESAFQMMIRSRSAE